MPATGKITLDASQYQATLERVKSETAKGSKSMCQSMDQFGKDVGKAGNTLKALGSTAGAELGNVGKVISGLAAGPVAALMAALGALVAAGKYAWDSLTVSTEEYANKLEKTSAMEEKYYSKLVQTQKEEDGYIERLKELQEKESLTNEEKDESLRLVDLLNSHYGDLGMTIDDMTGKVIGLTNAEKKLNEEQKKALITSIERQLEAEKAKADAETDAMFVGDTMHQFGAWLTGNWGDSIQASETWKAASPERRAQAAKTMLGKVTEEDQVDYFSKQIDRMNTIMDLQDRLNMLKENGVEMEKEMAAQMEKTSKASAAAADAEKRRIQAEQDAYERQMQAEADAERKKEEAAAAAARKQMEQEQAKEKAWQQARVNSVAALRDQALRISGQGKQADIEAALWNAAKTKGSDLTEDERSQVIDMTNLKRELSSISFSAPQDYGPRVNSLMARGGSEAPVKMPALEDIQTKTLDTVEKIQRLVDRINDNIDDWLTT